MSTGDYYPKNWDQIATRIKDKAGWCCERCHHPDDADSGHVLTVHHLDGNKSNCEDWNLAALCQRCHLHIQAKVDMSQMFFNEILDVSPWFKPHLEGYLAQFTSPANLLKTAATLLNRTVMALDDAYKTDVINWLKGYREYEERTRCV